MLNLFNRLSILAAYAVFLFAIWAIICILNAAFVGMMAGQTDGFSLQYGLDEMLRQLQDLKNLVQEYIRNASLTDDNQ